MIIIAIIRICGVHTAGSLQWINFWVHIEACVAVITVSSTAFRTFYISNHPRTYENQQPNPKYDRLSKPIALQKRSESNKNDTGTSITFPSTTSTGIHTHIRRSPSKPGFGETLQDDLDGDTIYVTHEISTDVNGSVS